MMYMLTDVIPSGARNLALRLGVAPTLLFMSATRRSVAHT
jgi:hypothetical protein